MDIAKGTRIGPFETVRSLRRGGMAEVFVAQSEKMPQEVVLKISRVDSSHPTYGNALKLESDILSRLSHPNIIKILPLPLGAKTDPFVARAINLDGQPWYYAMEYLNGGSLDDLIKKNKSLPIDLASAIGVSLINAVYYLHSVRVAHLDIKPENILLRFQLNKGARIEPVLIDFGVAARSMQGDASGGTLQIMAPEYLQKSKGILAPEINLNLAKVDIYALGVVVYKMWTGQYPFSGLTERSITSSILNTTPQPPRAFNPDLPREADQLMMYWLSKDPQDRPTLPQLKQQLATWAHGMTHIQQPVNQPAGWWPFGRR